MVNFCDFLSQVMDEWFYLIDFCGCHYLSMCYTGVLERGIDTMLLVSVAGEDLHVPHNGRSGITYIHIAYSGME